MDKPPLRLGRVGQQGIESKVRNPHLAQGSAKAMPPPQHSHTGRQIVFV